MSRLFSKCRQPYVAFFYFLTAICFTVFIKNPIFLSASLICALIFNGLLKNHHAFRTFFVLVPFFFFISFLNPLVSHWGSTVLFNIFEDSAKPFTLEALLYGMNMGLMFLCMVIWFLGFSKIMTTDKFTYIFGRFFPAISLTFTMILRLLPFIKKRTAEISEGQKAIKAENANPTVISTEAETVNFHVISTEAENANFHVISTEAKTVNFHVISTGARSAKWRNPPKLAEMISLFTAVFSSTLEDGISTAETMENRGWGKCRRTCFLSYRFRISDALLSIVLMLLYGILIFCEVNGGSTMGFYPTVNFSIKGNIFLIPEIAAYSGEMILLTIFCRK